MVKESSANYANFANGESKDTYHGAHGEYGGLGDTRNDNAKKKERLREGSRATFHVSRARGKGIRGKGQGWRAAIGRRPHRAKPACAGRGSGRKENRGKKRNGKNDEHGDHQRRLARGSGGGMRTDMPWLRETWGSRRAQRAALRTQSSWRGAWVRGSVAPGGTPQERV